eukprot:gene18673-21248_t
MELCTGGHLGNLLARQPKKYLDEAWAKQLALQLFSAVAHIHSRGIAHRDIKLQNILVDQNNDHVAQLKLIDFGYGSRYVGALPMRTKCGTPYTTAPEVIREHYDERCDVWSCGVVLYIMLCGRRPFEALNITGSLADAGKAAMITNILAGRYHFNHKPWQSVSKQGLLFVKSLLHPDFRQRMHSHEALENPWMVDTALASAHQLVLVSEKSFRAVENMRRMSDVTELQRTGMVALVFGINGKVTSDMSAVFQSFDTDSSGMLSLEEFSTAMHKLAPELLPEDMEKLFHIIDYDKNNLISYTEFLAATIDPRDVDIGELNKAFRVFDEDGNGYISKEEMRKIIKSQCEQAQANEGFDFRTLSAALDAEVDEKVNKIFSEADVNNDGAISHSEFLWVMTGLDFHLLDRHGVPVSLHEGGFSAKDSYLYNSKLNNSHDSMEWEKDPRFDEEMGFSPRSMMSQSSASVLMKQSFRGMPPRGPSDTASNNNTIVASTSYNSNIHQGSGRPLGARSGSFHGPGYQTLATPVNSPHAHGWPNGPLVAGMSARLDTFIEKNANNSSSSAADSESVPSDRPVQRSGKRSPVPAIKGNVSEKKDSPTHSAGKLSPRTIPGDTNAEFMNASKDDVSGQLRTSPLRQTSNQGNLAFYEEQPMINGLHGGSMDEMEDEVEMGTVVVPLSNPTSNPPSHPPSNTTSEKLVPALVVPRPTGSIIMPGGTSARSGQKANSVKFELQPMVSQNTVSTTSLASTNIYHRDEEEKEYVSSKGSAKESRGIGAMVSFSRQPSYRESTIIDASSGKDTIRVMSAKQQMFEEQQSQQQLSATSTRQNSGDVAVQYVQCVEKSDPAPPFLSRASSRVFSLSNMLRSPQQQHDLSHHNDNSSRNGGANTSPLPVMMDMSPPLVMVGSPGGYLAPLSRAASGKSMKLFGGEVSTFEVHAPSL